jgi:hypothetical protein
MPPTNHARGRPRPIIAGSLLLLTLGSIAGWSRPLRAAPPATERPPPRSEVEPHRFKLRTGSLEVGAAWRPEFYPPNAPCGYNLLCGVTPRLGFDFELGTRAIRLVVGSYSAPVPTFSGDLGSFEAYMIEVGALFGGPRVRGGIIANGGAINAGVAAVLRLSPWVDRYGNRHGIDIQASYSIFQPFAVALSYRFYPQLLELHYPKR